MADLNSVADLQAALRENMIAPTMFATITDLKAKHSSFLKGGELALATTVSTSSNRRYIWVPASTLTADDLAIVRPNDVSSTTPGRWLLVGTPMLVGSATFDPPNLADGAGTTTTVAVVGAVLGDMAVASFSLDLQGIIVTAYVSAADVVSVRFQNETGGALDLASGTLRALVLKQ